jgi:ABC-type branched-subunit amino acid transport system substrate-binding protein
MIYCINPSCYNPQNSNNIVRCQKCGSSLVIGNRCYRAIKPLYVPKGSDNKLYEVEDENGDRLILKVLINNSNRLIELFNREVQILQQLSHSGIPKFESHFKFLTSNNAEFRCLVMEKIEGQNLEQWLEENGSLSQKLALNWLKQLIEILAVVHRYGFLHQDIKPRNIMRKPDGKLVLLDFSNIPGIVSPGYTPSEQANGHAVAQSDFFALGRTFVHLLTGKHPLDLPKNNQTKQLIWHSQAPQVSPQLASLVDEMMSPSVSERPQNIQTVLARIDRITNNAVSPAKLSRAKDTRHNRRPTSSRQKRRLIGTAILSIAVATFISILLTIFVVPEQTCDLQDNDRISCGEESLFHKLEKGSNKHQGIESIKQHKYEKASKYFKLAIDNNKADAETLIYLNNAELEYQKSEFYTIAVVAPIDANPDLSMEILRGVAQAQTEINHSKVKINGKGIRVLIGDDANKEDIAKKVAESLLTRSKILGVVGHYASEMSLLGSPIYQKDDLVLVSYGSTSTDLSPYGLLPEHIFFRTIPNTVVAAVSLASYLSSRSDRSKIVVTYNPNSPFSRSLYDWFQLSVKAGKGEIVGTVNLCQEQKEFMNELQQILDRGVTAIALFPEAIRICNYSYENVENTLISMGKKYQIVGSWGLVRLSTLSKAGKEVLGKLVLYAPWHRLNPANNNLEFIKEARKLWGDRELWGEGVNGITATAYDATMALIKALKDLPPEKESQPSRDDIRKILAAENFQATGATGKISFNGGDRREPLSVLLKVVKSQNCNEYNYSFVPINYPLPQDEILDCQAIKE